MLRYEYEIPEPGRVALSTPPYPKALIDED